jgi:hypothetical protein
VCASKKSTPLSGLSQSSSEYFGSLELNSAKPEFNLKFPGFTVSRHYDEEMRVFVQPTVQISERWCSGWASPDERDSSWFLCPLPSFWKVIGTAKRSRKLNCKIHFWKCSSSALRPSTLVCSVTICLRGQFFFWCNGFDFAGYFGGMQPREKTSAWVNLYQMLSRETCPSKVILNFCFF